MKNLNINACTQVPYTGNNQDVLEVIRVRNNFYSREWMTFLQAKQMGRKILKGSKGVQLVKVFEVERKGKKETALHHFTVFNTLQTDVVPNLKVWAGVTKPLVWQG